MNPENENVIPPSEPPSLTSMLDDAFERATVEPAAPAPAVEPASAVPSRSSEAPVAGAGDAERPRDQFGRFAPKQAEAAGAAPQAGGPPAAPAAAAPALDAPQSWKDELKGEWGKIPAPVQQYVHQREQELQQGFQQVAQTRQITEAVLSEFVPYAEQLSKEGATPVTAIRTLLQTAHQLRTGGPEYKKAILLSLAQQYGVDLANPLNAELARAQAESANLSTERIYGQAQQTAQQQMQMQSELAAFANDPAHEYFQDVRGIMGELIGKGIAKDLQNAYDMAVGMHSGVRDKLIAKAVQQHTASTQQTQRATRAATMSATGAPGGAAMKPASPDTDLRASIAAAMGE